MVLTCLSYRESKMQRRQFLSYLVAQGSLTTLACLQSGCGTMLHNERVGQPHSHQIDWKIAALDGLGLLLFFVPGVAAFVVDFYTGAIYLPYDEHYLPYDSTVDPTHSRGTPLGNLPPPPSSASPPAANVTQSSAPGPQASRRVSAPASLLVTPRLETPLPPPQVGLRCVRVPRDQLRPQAIERVVSWHVGREVSLNKQQTRLSLLPRLDHFHEQRRRHESDHQFGFVACRFFDRSHRV